MSRNERMVIYLFGIGWFIGGLVYTYAGIIAPTPFIIKTLQSSENLKHFFEVSMQGWLPYTITFILFVVADFAQILVGTVFHRVFDTKDWRNDTMRLCFLLAGLSGILADLIMLASWNIMTVFEPQWPMPLLVNLWSILLLSQYSAIFLSAFAALMGGLALGLMYQLSRGDKRFSNGWRLFTGLIALLSFLFVLALLFGSYSTNLLPMGIIFMLSTVIAVPIWCFWSAGLLSKAFSPKAAI